MHSNTWSPDGLQPITRHFKLKARVASFVFLHKFILKKVRLSLFWWADSGFGARQLHRPSDAPSSPSLSLSLSLSQTEWTGSELTQQHQHQQQQLTSTQTAASSSPVQLQQPAVISGAGKLSKCGQTAVCPALPVRRSRSVQSLSAPLLGSALRLRFTRVEGRKRGGGGGGGGGGEKGERQPRTAGEDMTLHGRSRIFCSPANTLLLNLCLHTSARVRRSRTHPPYTLKDTRPRAAARWLAEPVHRHEELKWCSVCLCECVWWCYSQCVCLQEPLQCYYYKKINVVQGLKEPEVSISSILSILSVQI